MTSNNKPTPVDAAIGARVQKRRKALRLTRRELGHFTGVSASQIQRNETGCNRIPADRLYEFARILRVDPNYFLADFDDPAEAVALTKFLKDTLGRDLNTAFAAVRCPRTRVEIAALVAAISEGW